MATAIATGCLLVLAACGNDPTPSTLRSLGEGNYEALAIAATQIALDVTALEKNAPPRTTLDGPSLNVSLGLSDPFTIVSYAPRTLAPTQPGPREESASGVHAALSVTTAALCVEDTTLSQTVTVFATPNSIDLLFAPECTTDPLSADIHAFRSHQSGTAPSAGWTVTPSAALAAQPSWQTAQASLRELLSSLEAAEQSRRTLLGVAHEVADSLDATRDTSGLFPGLSAAQVTEQHLAPVLATTTLMPGAPSQSTDEPTDEPAAEPGVPVPTSAPQADPSSVDPQSSHAPPEQVEVTLWQPEGTVAQLCLSDPRTRSWVFIQLPRSPGSAQDHHSERRRENASPLGASLYTERSGLTGPLCQPLRISSGT